MRNKQGFTLVELLVVMAIIAILAAIVVPNASKFIGRARATRALAEIQGMETALTAMVTDAGRSSLSQMFIKGAVPKWAAGPGVSADQLPLLAAGNMQEAVKVYSGVVYDLLRYGRDVLRQDTTTEYPIRLLMDTNMLAKLGTSYMDVGNDSWGSAYNIFPGPWNVVTPPTTGTYTPIYFRKFSVDPGTSNRKPKYDTYCLKGKLPNGTDMTNRVENELQTIIGDDYQTWPDYVGFPADTNKSVYIWSLGENMRNGQMVYTAQFDPTNAVTWYPGAQDGSDIGGGDDVNNWDKDSTWTRFTN